MPVGGLDDLRLTLVILGHQRRRAQFQPVFEPTLEFAELSARGVEVPVCGNQDQLMVVVGCSGQRPSLTRRDLSRWPATESIRGRPVEIIRAG